MVTDVAGQEMQKAGQLVERRTFDGGGKVVPVLSPLHISMLMLVLYVEEPESNNAEEEDDGTLYDQESFPAKQKAKSDVDRSNQDIVEVLLTVNGAPAFKGNGGDAQHHPEVNDGYDDEHDNWRAEHPVLKPAPFIQFAVFLYGKEINVAYVPMFQLAGVSVVETVNPGPIGVGNRTEKRTNKADGIVNAALLEERIMAAIMLNDENTNQEECINCAKANGQPNGVINAEVHRNPKRNKRTKAAEHLPNCSSGISFLILGNDGFPMLQPLVDILRAFIDRTLHVL